MMFHITWLFILFKYAISWIAYFNKIYRAESWMKIIILSLISILFFFKYWYNLLKILDISIYNTLKSSPRFIFENWQAFLISFFQKPPNLKLSQDEQHTKVFFRREKLQVFVDLYSPFYDYAVCTTIWQYYLSHSKVFKNIFNVKIVLVQFLY